MFTNAGLWRLCACSCASPSRSSKAKRMTSNYAGPELPGLRVLSREALPLRLTPSVALARAG
eukprot:15202686-Alexandrium_andersonii.AAC.1